MAPPLVVIGTSLGGLNALQVVLARLPHPLRPAVAIVQHRIKGAETGLTTLLQAASRAPVREPEDKEAIEPGHIYLAPGDYHLLVERHADGHHLALSTEGPVCWARPSIDVLLESAADAYGPALVAVILTGANEDGANGALRVRQRGGTVLVEDPATAVSSIMPAAAAARAGVTRTHPLKDLADELAALCAR
jgi:two-component system chemotaxis response regulator CheB